jgi:hypothetical protein
MARAPSQSTKVMAPITSMEPSAVSSARTRLRRMAVKNPASTASP